MPDHVFHNPPNQEAASKIGAAMRQGTDGRTSFLTGDFMAVQKGQGGLHPKSAAKYLDRLDEIDESDVGDKYWEPFEEYREGLREKLQDRTIDRTS
jgi:hypothetical protein